MFSFTFSQTRLRLISYSYYAKMKFFQTSEKKIPKLAPTIDAPDFLTRISHFIESIGRKFRFRSGNAYLLADRFRNCMKDVGTIYEVSAADPFALESVKNLLPTSEPTQTTRMLCSMWCGGVATGSFSRQSLSYVAASGL